MFDCIHKCMPQCHPICLVDPGGVRVEALIVCHDTGGRCVVVVVASGVGAL